MFFYDFQKSKNEMYLDYLKEKKKKDYHIITKQLDDSLLGIEKEIVRLDVLHYRKKGFNNANYLSCLLEQSDSNVKRLRNLIKGKLQVLVYEYYIMNKYD